MSAKKYFIVILAISACLLLGIEIFYIIFTLQQKTSTEKSTTQRGITVAPSKQIPTTGTAASTTGTIDSYPLENNFEIPDIEDHKRDREKLENLYAPL